MSEHDERDERPSPAPREPVEGVRILGAQEAAAIDADRRRGPRDTDTDSGTDDADARERAWPAEGPSWSASADPGERDADTDPEADGDDIEVVTAVAADTDLPHWSEPATGQVPAVFVDATGDDDDLDAWAALSSSQPRYRSEGGDWADADFTEALAADDDEDLRQGALAEPEPDVADDDEAFVQAVRARRGCGAGQVVTSTPQARRSPGVAPRPRRANAPRPGDMLPASGRDLNTALISAAIFAVIAIACFIIGTAATTALAAVVLGVCALELSNALHEKGLRPAVIPVVAACAAMPIAAYAYSGLSAFPVLFTLVTLTSLVYYLAQVGPGRPLIGVALSVFVFAYVGGLGGYAGLLLAMHDGIGLLVGVVACVIAYDVVGYFVGSQFGHSPIAPRVSPNKTVEGTLAGVGASVVVAMVVLARFSPWDDKKVVVMGAVGLLFGVAALLGDLCESMLKRDLGLKDFGSLLPGHGGFLDRFDGLLFALPVAFYVALHIF